MVGNIQIRKFTPFYVSQRSDIESRQFVNEKTKRKKKKAKTFKKASLRSSNVPSGTKTSTHRGNNATRDRYCALCAKLWMGRAHTHTHAHADPYQWEANGHSSHRRETRLFCLVYFNERKHLGLFSSHCCARLHLWHNRHTHAPLQSRG